jgi:surface protein
MDIKQIVTPDDIESLLGNTSLPLELINIIVFYTHTSIKILFTDDKTNYFTNSNFKLVDCEDILVLDIYGILILHNPQRKFFRSEIKTINGNVIIKGDCNNMFYSAKNFTGDVSKWDTSEVTNMYSMFNQAINFNCDISDWKTSNVTDMSYMFPCCIKFDQDIREWDTSSVEDMSWMFYNAISFNKDISKWDTSNVLDVDSMFKDATEFKGYTLKIRGKYEIIYNNYV